MMQLKMTRGITALLLTVGMLLALGFVSKAYANPVDVAWYVTDVNGIPVDGAKLEIYWSTSPSGPFTLMPADSGQTWVKDQLAGVKQNPIITGYKNPDHPHGIGIADVHPHGGLSGLYFYVKITLPDSSTFYWPVQDSGKPTEPIPKTGLYTGAYDPDWAPVSASGSPSGYAAEGPGIGNGVTTAYPTHPPIRHPPGVPEFGLGIETITGLGMLIAYAIKRKQVLGKE